LGRTRAVEIDANVEAGTAPEEAGGEEAASLFDATGDSRVRILRRDAGTQKMTTHGFFPPTVKEEDVAAAFGGGEYRAQLVIPDPATGLSKIKRSRDFKIPGAYRPPNKINAFDEVGPNGSAATPAAAAAATAMQGLGGGGDLMAVLNAGVVSTLLDLLKTTKEINSRPNAGPDPMLLEVMKAQAATQTQMMQFMLTLATKDSGDSKKDILDMMARMKELVGPSPTAPLPSDPMQMFNNMLETFKSFRDTAEEISPQKDNPDPILGSIPALVQVVSEQHQMNKAAQAARGGTMVPVPPPAPGAPIVGTLPADAPMWKRILQQQGARLLAQAAAKGDPDVIAGASIVFAPPNVREALMGFFKRDENEVMADILTEIPAMAEHREWLAEFVDAAQQRLFPEMFIDAPEGEDKTTGEAE
jgi:hypothetical protein